MKIEIDTKNVKSDIVKRVLNTKAGAFAAALDEMLYNGSTEEKPSNTFSARKFSTSAETRIRVEGNERESVSTEEILRNLRDWLYKQAFESHLNKW